jgi:hypothetical protein
VAAFTTFDYRGQIAALQRQLPAARRLASVRAASPSISPPESGPAVPSTSVTPLASGPLTGKVTFIAVGPPELQA